MPTRAYNAAERKDAEAVLGLHMLGAFVKSSGEDDTSSGDSSIGDALLLGVLEPLSRSMRTRIGPA
jgi:hypothetical protein